MLYFWLSDARPNSLEDLADNGPQHHFLELLDQTGLLTALSGSSSARTFIYWAIAALLVAFIAGVLTRITYLTFVCLFWLAAFLQTNGHATTPLLLALLATVPVPWGERWSVDALFRRGQANHLIATPLYGYGIWLLGVTIGITYTTAGLSKLVVTEGRWLWETGARNGFMQDFGIAATDWGMTLVNNYYLALGASAMAAFGQAIYVYSSFTRSGVIKYAVAFGIAFPFATGLVLFMGHFWWPWIILIVMLYLPWGSIDRLLTQSRGVYTRFGESQRARRHQCWFLGAVGSLFALHAYAIVTKSEYEPLYSNYQMYAQGMQAGSVNEVAFWSNYKKADRHYKFMIQIVGDESVVDIGNYYHLAWNLERFNLWYLDAARLKPKNIVRRAERGDAIGSEMCSTLKSVAMTYLPDEQVRTMRFAKRYIDMVDGRMIWLPIDHWIEVDLAAPACSYKRVQDVAT